MKLYISNLPYTSSDEDIFELFSKHGLVQGVDLMIDYETGRCRGFGFVDMQDEEAQGALSALDGAHYGGRTLIVSEAHSES